MKIDIQLIQLYLWVCGIYNKHTGLKFQRWSNNINEPRFSDQEIITVYLFGTLKGRFQQKDIYNYIKEHWSEWFPQLPSYQAFNHRLNILNEVLPVLLWELWQQLGTPDQVALSGMDQMLDSLPIMLAVRGRSFSANVALDIADTGYCDSKDLYYHGVKLHMIVAKEYKKMPVPLCLSLSEASRHDLPLLREHSIIPLPGTLFGDKAYCDKTTQQMLADQGITLCTPDKKEKGQKVYPVGHSGLWSRFVSGMRQPVESFFNWLVEKTGIQNAAKVRSSEGLLVHCYGKLAAAFYLLCFNS